MSFVRVEELLTRLGLPHLTKNFIDEKYDDECLLDATDKDLENLGLCVGERKKLLRILKNVKSTQDIEDTLAKFYNSEDCSTFRRMDKTKLSLDACYVNLAVVPMDSYNIMENRENKNFESDFMRPRSSEELISDKSNIIKLKNLFDKNKNDSENFEWNWDNVKQKRILIFGRAGVGKTTLCKKVVYSYFKENIWKNYFHRVVWLTLRDLKLIEKPAGKKHAELSDVYTHQFFNKGEDGETFSKILHTEEKEGKKILFILDGWDEIQELLGQGHHMRSVLLDELLKKPFLIVTSRPYTMELESSYFDQVLETVGFTKKNIFRYIKNVIPEDISQQNKILNFINSHSVISGIASIPIQLDMLCYLCNNIEDVEECLHTETVTMTKLYDVLVKKMLDMNQIRKNQAITFEWISFDYKKVFTSLKNGGHCQDMSQVFFLSEVAYHGMNENKIEFNDKFFSNAKSYSLELRNQMKDSYFLNCLNPSEIAIEKKSYTFIHLTFQEFMAALYIVHHLEQDEVLQRISKNKYNPRFQIVWSFVAGLIEDPNILNVFFNYLERSPIDITGIPHQILMLNCINECGNLMGEKRMNRLLDDMWNWLKSDNWCAGDLQLPKKIYENRINSILSLDDETLISSEAFLGFTNKIPDSLIRKLIDTLFQEEFHETTVSPNPKLIESVKKILSCKYRFNRFISVKIAELVESLLKEEISKLKARKHVGHENYHDDVDDNGKIQKTLIRCEFLIKLLRGSILNDSTWNTLLELFDFMLEEIQMPVSYQIHLAISMVVGNEKSSYKFKLLEKLVEMLQINKVPNAQFIRTRSIHCLWQIKKLPMSTQDILAGYIGKIPMQLLTLCLWKQRIISPYVIEKLIDHVTTTDNHAEKKHGLRVLQTQKDLSEETQWRIFHLYHGSHSKMKMNILVAFRDQNKLCDSVANQVLAEFVNQIKNDKCAYIDFIILALQNTEISEQIVEKLEDLFNTFDSEDNSLLVIQVLKVFKIKKIPDNMIDKLYSRMGRKSHDILALIKIFKCLEFQCAFCENIQFPLFLIESIMKDNRLVKPIVNIFRQHQHLLGMDAVILRLGQLMSNPNNIPISNVLQVLAHCKNAPADLLLNSIRFLINPPDESLCINNSMQILRILIRNQSKLPETVLQHIFDSKNWKALDWYQKNVFRLVRHLSLEEIINNLSSSNWKNVFGNVIVSRLRASSFPVPVIQIIEEKDALSIFTPVKKEPLEIKHLELWHTLRTIKNVPNLPLRPDFLTLYLQFHTKQENLQYIEKFQKMNFQYQKANLFVYTNNVGKYLRIHFNTLNPSEEDFKFLFEEIEWQLQNNDFLHIDLRNNYLDDNRITQLKGALRNGKKNISTLILSDQKITSGEQGLRSMMESSFCKEIGLKRLFLDRNQIYLSGGNFLYVLQNNDSLLAKSGLEILELSGNFIPEGRLLSPNDNVLAEKDILVSNNISEEDIVKNMTFIKNSPIVNSSDVGEKSLGFMPIHTPFYKIKNELTDCRISKSLGCIVLGHKKLGPLSKHAFFVIEWVPPRQSEGYGQRQLIKSELLLANDDHIKIRIVQVSPEDFVSLFQDKSVKIKSVMFRPTEQLYECLKWIYTSRDIADTFSYKLLASLKSSRHDKLNCITWTDIMLEKCGIANLDSMKEIYPVLSRLPI